MASGAGKRTGLPLISSPATKIKKPATEVTTPTYILFEPFPESSEPPASTVPFLTKNIEPFCSVREVRVKDGCFVFEVQVSNPALLTAFTEAKCHRIPNSDSRFEASTIFGAEESEDDDAMLDGGFPIDIAEELGSDAEEEGSEWTKVQNPKRATARATRKVVPFVTDRPAMSGAVDPRCPAFRASIGLPPSSLLPCKESATRAQVSPPSVSTQPEDLPPASPAAPSQLSTARPKARRHPGRRRVQPVRDPTLVTILVRPRDEGGSLHDISRKDIAAAVGNWSPNPVGVRRISGSGYAFDFPANTPTGPLLETPFIAGISVKAFLPAARKTHSGTITGPYSSAEEVKELYSLHDNPELKSVTQIGKTTVFRLQFVQPALPDKVVIFYNLHRVMPFFNQPTRCYRCHRFNHVANVCKSREVCGRCSLPGHSFKNCVAAALRCPNCGGPHSSADRQCPHWIFELRVRKTQARDDCSFLQARSLVCGSYAEAVKKSSGQRKPTPAPRPARAVPVPPPCTTETAITKDFLISSLSAVMKLCVENLATPSAIPGLISSFLRNDV